MDALVELLERFSSPRVVLVGDFILDRYVYGNVDRLSPEAPVPVLNVVRREMHPGGAASVAAAIIALDAKATCIGVLGKDTDADELNKMLGEAGADTTALLRLDGRCTTVKTRHVGLAQHRHAQQMLRVDDETSRSVPVKGAEKIAAALRSHVAKAQIVALQDYDKGVLTDTGTPELIAIARKAGVKVVADPARISNFGRYRGASVLTPNRYEAELASSVKIVDDASMERAAREIMQTSQADAVVITLDKEGAFLLQRDGQPTRVPTRPRSVYDVAGAGDEVLAMLSVALGQGIAIRQAVELANVAGGLEIERFGVVPISRADVIEEMRRMIGLRGGKVMARKDLLQELGRRRRAGHTIVFTNGCFDLLHMGHVQYLQQARELGSCMVVAVNSDASAARLKGPGRPVTPAEERAEMIGALECVDYVTIFDEDTPEPLLELIKPDILVKGGTTTEVVGRGIVEAYGGRVLTVDRAEGLSTTNIIDRVLDTAPAVDD
ncbi:MAG: bifunctional heptose 7-phosphate kinase/heptose 1-phosphate adenyltransferase [Phycisphaerae bacterium]|nr:bifunctional heptose 7-phosphate kinase/heptose 1-phosphate adenyltransferase [Phycisphaerae bacterium]